MTGIHMIVRNLSPFMAGRRKDIILGRMLRGQRVYDRNGPEKDGVVA